MKYVYIIILLVAIRGLTPFSVQAQDAIHIGTRHTLFSQLLNEERAYWVYEPERQAGDSIRNLPVLYLLDGDVFFHSVVGFTRFFSSSKVSSLPPCIVVAVLNTDRTRDFTPTCSAARRDGTIHSVDKPQGGGTCAGDLRELVRVPLRSQGHCGLEGPLGTPVVLVLWKRASS